MPTLEWIGKSKVINHHQDVPFRVLERKYSFDENGQHNEDNGSENMIIRGDNLEALKALLPRYEGRVKCIYIDPPYNTGNEGWVYNDNVKFLECFEILDSSEDQKMAGRGCRFRGSDPPRQVAVHDVSALETFEETACARWSVFYFHRRR